MKQIILLGGEQKNQSVKLDGICTCLTSSMGMGGGYVPLVILPKVIKRRTDNEQRYNGKPEKS